MPPEIVSANETTVEVLSPVDMTVLQTVTFTEDVSISERPVYAMRGVARSGARSAPIQMSAGQVTMRRNVDTAAIYDELRRWRYGVLLFSLQADLRGKRLRHPHLRITKRNADGVTVERRTAYDCKLNDYTLNKPAVGLLTESFTIDSLGGIDTPGADHYEPAPPLAFFRTGPKTYVNSAGTLSTAADGAAAYGLPYVVRRNLLNYSEAMEQWSNGSAATVTANQKLVDLGGNIGLVLFDKVTSSAAAGYAGLNSITTGSVLNRTFTFSVWVVSDVSQQVSVKISDTITEDSPYTTVTAGPTPQRVTLTYTFTSGTNTFLRAFLVPSLTAAANAYFYGAQLEESATATPYQATNSSGVELANPINGAGLVLEGPTTNGYPAPNDCETVPTGTLYTWSGTALTVATDATTYYQGSNSLKFTGAAAGHTGYYANAGHGILTYAVGTYYTFSVFAKTSTSGATLGFYAAASSLGYNMVPLIPDGQWRRYSWTFAATSGGQLETHLYAVSLPTGGGTVWLDAGQVEALPFATSWVEGTRNADLCGIVSPHNLSPQSQNFADAGWTKNYVTSTSAADPFGGATAATVNMAGGSGAGLYRTSLGLTFDGSTRTASFWLKGAVGGEMVTLQFQRSDTHAAVTQAQLTLTADWRRYSVTTSSTLAGIGIEFGVFLNQTTSSFDVCGGQLVDGSNPGIYVRTGDRAVSRIPGGGLDPYWIQNGYIEWNSVHPADVGVLDVSGFWMFLGSGTSYPGNLALYRYPWETGTNYVKLRRGNDVSAVTADVSVAGSNLYDGARHRLRMEWANYTNSSGVREMWFKFYIDGTLMYSVDVAATQGAKSWLSPEASTMLSGGSTQATISNLVLGYPTLPAGAIHDQQAA